MAAAPRQAANGFAMKLAMSPARWASSFMPFLKAKALSTPARFVPGP